MQQLNFNSENELISTAEIIRIKSTDELDSVRQKENSQYFTPLAIAEFMAAITPITRKKIRILDPGAGTGILTASIINRIAKSKLKPEHIIIKAIESDTSLIKHLTDTLKLCKQKCHEIGINCETEIESGDFIEFGVKSIKSYSNQTNLFFKEIGCEQFDLVIMNPPYKKILSDSRTRKLLSSVGIEISNLYSAFLAIAVHLLKVNGHLVAITPRSFTNGPYFKPFRELFFRQMSLSHIHIFNSRTEAFKENEVLQENIIFHAIKNPKNDQQSNSVKITSSDSPDDDFFSEIKVPHDCVVNPNDPNKIIHIIPDRNSEEVIKLILKLPSNLDDLGIRVSTGRVVDFRAKKFLCSDNSQKSVPLIYPTHFKNGFVEWPNPKFKKPDAIFANELTEHLLVEKGYYVLCRRFSTKEEKRRLVAAFFDPQKFDFDKVGFENHLNYFYHGTDGLEEKIARGLTLYLNSTLIDLYFRLFSGHTQVNASDIRMLKFPSREQLEILSYYFTDELPSQLQIDSIIDKEIFRMEKGSNPASIKHKIEDAISVLKQLGLPKGQQNERSGLTLLALLDLKPDDPWSAASSPLVGITEMMYFFRDHYGKEYAPNSRETVRRFTIHQFIQAGIVVPNPDKSRPINSPQFVYQIEPSALKLIREFDKKSWKRNLNLFLASIDTLREQYKQARDLQRIPIKITEKKEIHLSPGGQNVLIKKIIDDFCSMFTPGADFIYLGDTETKWAYYDNKALTKLGVKMPDEHGKMPDVVVHYKKENWLVLIEAVTSHGPINLKRKIELKSLFEGCQIGLVFVTAFLDRRGMLRYLNELAWETEVWVADSPTHLIHFNGKRFLGPYKI